MRSKPTRLITEEGAIIEVRQLKWIFSASRISVKFKCEHDIQSEAAE